MNRCETWQEHSDVEQEIQHVAVLDHVFLAFGAHLAGVLGALLALTGAIWLLTVAVGTGDGWKIFSMAVYGTTLVMLYSISTVYHSVRGRAKDILRKLDHLSIYLLIAGSYTPFCLISLRGPWGWSLFAWVWTGAVGMALLPLADGRQVDLVAQVRPKSAGKLGARAVAAVELGDPKLADVLKGRTTVVQLIGTMRKRFASGDTYESSDIGTTRQLVDAAKACGTVDHFILLSSVGARGAAAARRHPQRRRQPGERAASTGSAHKVHLPTTKPAHRRLGAGDGGGRGVFAVRRDAHREGRAGSQPRGLGGAGAHRRAPA